MKFYALSSLSAFLAVVTANKKVMKIINDDHKILRAQGLFDKMFERESVKGNKVDCIDGVALVEGEEFPCKDIDFLSFVSAKDLDIPEPAHRVGASSADIWGWLSPTNREFTTLALDNGVAIIDGTDPINPCIIAKMPTRRVVDKWGDVKVYNNTLYHVKDTGVQDEDDDAPEGNAVYGIEVYDLLQLDQLDCSAPDYVPINLFPQFVFEGHGRSHNVAINTQSGMLYSTGSQKCAGGLVVLDLKPDPLHPKQVGCVDSDGYTHDVQCLSYDGPDQDHQGKEICFAYNEDTLTIWDVTVPENPVNISRTLYPNHVYSHQGWVNDDLTKCLLDDELDEICNADLGNHPRCTDFDTDQLTGELNTTTNVFDITDLDDPKFETAYVHPNLAIDHNLYVWGTVHKRGWGGNNPLRSYPDPNFAYMANYLAGVRVVDISDKDPTKWTEAGFFDIAPDASGASFAGAWSTYMHPSGALAVSSIERGLFFLSPRMAFTEEFPKGELELLPFPPIPPLPTPAPTPGTNPAGPVPTDPVSDDASEDSNAALIVVAVIMVIVLVGMLAFTAYRQKTAKDQTRAPSREVAASQVKPGSRAGPPSSTMNPMAKLEEAE